jgi:hypothetical protein
VNCNVLEQVNISLLTTVQQLHYLFRRALGTLFSYTIISKHALFPSPRIMPPPDKAQAAAPRPRPYRDFLTPLFHRMFTKSMGVMILLCWAISTCMSLVEHDADCKDFDFPARESFSLQLHSSLVLVSVWACWRTHTLAPHSCPPSLYSESISDAW